MHSFVVSEPQQVTKLHVAICEGCIALLEVLDDPFLPLPLSHVPLLEILPGISAMFIQG